MSDIEMGVGSQHRVGSFIMQVPQIFDAPGDHDKISQGVEQSRRPLPVKDHSAASFADAKHEPNDLSDEYWRGKEWAAALFPDAATTNVPPLNKPRVDKFHRPHALHRSGSMLETSQRPHVRVMTRSQRLRKTLRNEGCADASSAAILHNSSSAAPVQRISISRPANNPRPMVRGQTDGNEKVADCHALGLHTNSREVAVESPCNGEPPAGLFVSPHCDEAPADLLVSDSSLPPGDQTYAGAFTLHRQDSLKGPSPRSSASFADGAESVASDELLEGEVPEDSQNLAGSFKASAYRRPDFSYWSSPVHEDGVKKTPSIVQLSPESPSFEHGLLKDDAEKTIKLDSPGRLSFVAHTQDLALTPGVTSLAGSPGTEAMGPNASIPSGTPLSASMTPDKRRQLIDCIFDALVTKDTTTLQEGEMYKFAKAMDYPEGQEAYAEEYKCVCESEEVEPRDGLDKQAFQELVDLEEGDYFIGDASLQSVLDKVTHGQTCEQERQRSLHRSQSSQSSGSSERKSLTSMRSPRGQSSRMSQQKRSLRSRSSSGEEESMYESAEEESRASDQEVTDSEEEGNKLQRNTSSHRKVRSSHGSRSSSKLTSEEQPQQLGAAVTDASRSSKRASDARSSFNGHISNNTPMTDAVASSRATASTDAVIAHRGRSQSPTNGTDSAGMESVGSSELAIEEEEEEEQDEHDSEVETDEE